MIAIINLWKISTFEIFVFFLPAILLYLIPSIIALARDHSSKFSVFLLNLFLGWTFLGWIGALIWACASSPTVVVNHRYPPANKAPQVNEITAQQVQKDYDDKLEHLQKLKQLFDSGVLSEEEFAKEKEKVLNGN